ncbi:(Fe-S)-binding protein [Phascolarctobacterium succinatutens]
MLPGSDCKACGYSHC